MKKNQLEIWKKEDKVIEIQGLMDEINSRPGTVKSRTRKLSWNLKL